MTRISEALLDTDSTVVSESSGTALIAAAFYRYSVMAAKSSDKYLQDNASGLKEQADTAFKGVVAKVKEDGWLKTVCSCEVRS
jgi:rhamnogalacturonyl hydrolase YesR